MSKHFAFLFIALAVSLNLAMARSGQYDEDARQQEKTLQPIPSEEASSETPGAMKNFATGIKEVTVDNVKDTLEDTGGGIISKEPVVGTLDGTQQAGEKVVDNTIRGVKKVASLGYAKDDSYEIEQAEKGSGDAAKIKLFKF